MCSFQFVIIHFYLSVLFYYLTPKLALSNFQLAMFYTFKLEKKGIKTTQSQFYIIRKCKNWNTNFIIISVLAEIVQLILQISHYKKSITSLHKIKYFLSNFSTHQYICQSVHPPILNMFHHSLHGLIRFKTLEKFPFE